VKLRKINKKLKRDQPNLLANLQHFLKVVVNNILSKSESVYYSLICYTYNCDHQSIHEYSLFFSDFD